MSQIILRRDCFAWMYVRCEGIQSDRNMAAKNMYLPGVASNCFSARVRCHALAMSAAKQCYNKKGFPLQLSRHPLKDESCFSVEITRSAVISIEGGLAIGKLLDSLGMHARAASGTIYASLKTNVTDSGARRHNWNILCSVLKANGIIIDKNTQSLFQSGDTRSLTKFLHSLSKKYRNYENKRSKRNLDMEREARHAQRTQMERLMGAGAHISYAEAKAKEEEDRLQNQELKKKKQMWLREEQERINGQTSVRARNRYAAAAGGDALGSGLGGPFAQSDLYAEPDTEPRFAIRAKELEAIEKDGAARALSDPQSCQDMLLGTMCKGLAVRPRQAASLLGSNVRHLATVLTAGIQGQFGAVVAWLELVHARSREVYALIQASEGSRQQAHETAVNVYVLLRPALLSANPQVAVWGMRIFAEMAGDLLKTFIHAASHEFLLESGRGLEALVLCHKRHCSRPGPAQVALGDELPRLLASAGKFKLRAVLGGGLMACMPDAVAWMSFIADLIAAPTAREKLIDGLAHEGVVDMIVDYGCTFAAPSQPRRVRVAAFFLLGEVWTRVPAEHIEREENPKRILSALKRGVRDPSEPIQVEAITALFRLLDVFAADLSPYAPFVYKTLVFALIGSHDTEMVREYILVNLSSSLERMPQVPVGVVVEPAVKQYLLYGYMNLDFEFMVALARHGRLALRHALMLLDLLGKVCLNDPLYGRAATVPLLVLLSRFHFDDVVVQYVNRFVQVALSMFMHVEMVEIQALEGLKSKYGQQSMPGGARKTTKYSAESQPFSRLWTPCFSQQLWPGFSFPRIFALCIFHD